MSNKDFWLQLPLSLGSTCASAVQNVTSLSSVCGSRSKYGSLTTICINPHALQEAHTGGVDVESDVC